MNSSNLPAVSEDPPFDQMLAYAMAENRVAAAHKPWTETELCEQFDISQDDLDALKQSKTFAKAVTMAVSELKKGSGAVEAKAKALFEHYTDIWVPAVMQDRDAPLAEKVKIYTMLGKTGKVLQDTVKTVEGSGGQSNTPTLRIILTQAPVAQPVMKDVIDVN